MAQQDNLFTLQRPGRKSYHPTSILLLLHLPHDTSFLSVCCYVSDTLSVDWTSPPQTQKVPKFRFFLSHEPKNVNNPCSWISLQN